MQIGFSLCNRKGKNNNYNYTLVKVEPTPAFGELIAYLFLLLV